MITVSIHISEAQLASFKKQLGLTLVVLERIAEHWKHDKSYTILSVLIQNAAASSVGCYGYTHDKEIKRTNTALIAVEALCKYNEHHVTEWLLDEIDIVHLDIQHSDL